MVFKTDLYVTGVEMTMSWLNAEEQREGHEFLTRLVGPPAGQTDGAARAYYCIHDKAMFEALMDFRKALRDKRLPEGKT